MNTLNLTIDTGLKEFSVNGRHTMSFNPSDPSVYNRFMEVMEDISSIEDNYIEKMQSLALEAETVDLPETVDSEGFKTAKNSLLVMKEADSAVKEKLNYVFGSHNNFDEILDGVNVLAVADNGERVITNLLTALTPILEKGIQKHADQRADEAVQTANLNREQRRALAKVKKL